MHLTATLFVIALLMVFLGAGLYWRKGRLPASPGVERVLARGVGFFRRKGPTRRTERVELEVPILVSGLDANGEKFEDCTETKTISGYGAAIYLLRPLKPGQEIQIHRVDKSRSTTVRVLHELSTKIEGRLFGVTFVDPTIDLWGARQLLTEAQQGESDVPSPETAQES